MSHKYKSARRSALKSIITATLTATALTAGSFGLAQAEGWKAGTVKLIVPAKPGGGTDSGARIIAVALEKAIGSPVIVVNNVTGGGAVAAEQVRTAKPDGHTLLYYHTGLVVKYHTGGYTHSPVTDFTTVASLPVGGSFSLAVPANSPYKTAEEFIAATKAKPNKLTLGVQLRGGSHFMSALLQMDSDAKYRIVEAGSDADKFVQLQGNQIDAAIVNTPGTLTYVKSGDLRILATIAGTPARDPGAPDSPSLSELGYKKAVYGTDFLILGPLGMDKSVVEKINAAVGTALSDESVSGKLAKMRMPVSHTSVEVGKARLTDSNGKVKVIAEMLGMAK